MRATYGNLWTLRTRSPARPPRLELESGFEKLSLCFSRPTQSFSYLLIPSLPFLSLLHFSLFLYSPFFSACSFWTWPNVAVLAPISMFSLLKYLHQLESSSLRLKISKERDLIGLASYGSPWGHLILIREAIGWWEWGLSSVQTQPHSSQVMVGCHFGKWVYCMSWSPGGMRDESILVSCKISPTMEKKTKSHAYSKGTCSFIFLKKGNI